MAIDFENAVVAGTVLIREDVESQNYETGVSGWAIFSNGDAEFNNGIFRGQLTAGSITSGSIGDSTIVNSTFNGGNINNSTIVFDDVDGGQLLGYAVTQVISTHTVTGTFIVPAGVTSVKIESWAGGGGGYGGNSNSGGGGGEYACDPVVSVTPLESLDVIIGTGGAGGLGVGAGIVRRGVTGNDSAVQRSGVDLVRANGGAGGINSLAAGGTGSSDPIHFDGGSASTAALFPPGTGGHGGASSAGTSAVGTNSSPRPSASTNGAPPAVAPSGGGNGAGGGNSTGVSGTAGLTGSIPGGGGGGGGTGSGSSSSGGTGARGQVLITYQTGQSRVFSISPVAGTDVFGEAFPSGISTDFIQADAVVTNLITADNPRVHAYDSVGNLIVSAGAVKLILFDAEIYDSTGTMHTGGNPSRIVAPIDGLYAIDILISMPGSTYIAGIMNTRQNAAGNPAAGTSLQNTDFRAAGGATSPSPKTTLKRLLVAGDYIEVFVSQTSGGNQTNTAGAYAARVFMECLVPS